MSIKLIAEIGSNHLNDEKLLEQLIDDAAFSGFNAIKLQMFNVDRIWTTKEEADKRRKFELDKALVPLAYEMAQRHGLEFLCTPFSPASVQYLRPYVKQWKIASPHIGDRELRDAICEDQKPILMSCGAIGPNQVRDYQKSWIMAGKDVRIVTPLHCVGRYPAAPSDYGIQSWLIRTGFYMAGVHGSWGISDHTAGIGTAIAAVASRACVVEKHIALKDQPPSPDDGVHALRPVGQRALCAGIRQAEAAILGTVAAPTYPPARRVWR